MQDTQSTLQSTDPQLVVRTARKAWRCVCADPVRRFEVKRHCEHGWSAGSCRTEAEVEAWKLRIVNQPCHGGKLPQQARLEVTPIRNPNYRDDCLGDIAPGETYVEYLGEAEPYAHGSSYCPKCAVAVWSEVAA